MVKPAITAILALLCLVLVKANIDTFRTAPPALETEIKSSKGGAKRISPIQPLNLNPKTNRQLPDLSSGYLFNTARFLAKDARTSPTGTGYGQNIRIDDVVFSGAILGDGYKKALVSYSPGPQATARTVRSGPKTQAPSGQQTILLAEGDQLGGYTVKEIAADFILFVKGSDTIKKLLFDPDKKRQQVKPQPTSSSAPKKINPGVPPARRVTPASPTRP